MGKQVTISMSRNKNAFGNDKFVKRFSERRDAFDSVNRFVDEPALFRLLGDVSGKQILEVGCGLGELCKALHANGAAIRGIDMSSNMINEAKKRNPTLSEQFEVSAIESYRSTQSFDIIISAMALHFVPDVNALFQKVFNLLVEGGVFIFSQRHPVRTCHPGSGQQENSDGWYINDYFSEGARDFIWLGHEVHNYHRTISSIFNALAKNDFMVLEVCEPQPIHDSAESERLKECNRIPAILTFKCQKTAQAHR